MRLPLIVMVSLVLPMSVWLTPALSDVEMNPDENTLWIEDFDPLETSADSRQGWFGFEPEEISADQAGPEVRFREVSEHAGGSIQRTLPLGDPMYRYLQVRVTYVEDEQHYLKAWLRLPEAGHPQLGRLPEGLCTIDLSGLPFFGEQQEVPLDLAIMGPRGRAPSGAVGVDWLRLVRSPVGGLTVGLIDAGEENGVAEIGDSLALTYTSDQPVTAPVAVTLRRADDGTSVRLSELRQVSLADDGENGDAMAGDGLFAATVAITPAATELTTGAGGVIATADVDSMPRNACPLFSFRVVPAAFRAAEAATGTSVGEEILSEDFALSDTHDWRAYDDGWAVHRPDREGEPFGLRNLTYDRPCPSGRWIALPAAPLSDASLSARLRPLGGAGPIMLGLRFQDPENHYRLEIARRSEVAIVRVRSGWREALAETKLAKPIAGGDDGPASLVSFTAAGPTLVARIDGKPVLHAVDNTFREGRAALGLNRLNGQFETVMLRSASATRPPEEYAGSGLRMRLALRERDRYFGRDAGTIPVPMTIENVSAENPGELEIAATLVRRSIYADPVGTASVPEAPPGSSQRVTIPLDPSRFRSGTYWLVVRARADGEVVGTDATRIEIGRPVSPERMDVFWWGGANIAEQLEAVADAGVTVVHEFSQRSPELRALGCRLGVTYYSYPPSLRSAPDAVKESFRNPQAGPHTVRADELDPAFREWALETARKHARAWRGDPRLRYVLLNTEYENHAYPNLSGEAEARYEARLGFRRPAEATLPFMVPETSVKLFPDRIIPDDAPLYAWYRFFHTQGGALNGITCAQAEEYAKIAPGIVTLHDPVLRAPQFHGRWDGMRLLNHWTYVEQNPLDLAAFADELVCLGKRSNWDQQISQMIQAFGYADSAMPGRGPGAPEYLRDAPFVAIPPDILTESAWLAMSRPIDMIAFHGLNAAIETQEKEAYRYTNPSTLTGLGRVTKALIEPYGPALRRIKDREGPRVALLLSAANTVFGRIPEGGGTRSLHNPLTAARIPVDVLYDEDVQDGALQEYRALAIPQCRFLLESVRRRIAEFQDAGGTVLLDRDARINIPGAIMLPEASSTEAEARQLELVPGEVLEVPNSTRGRLDADLRVVAEELRKELLHRIGEPPFVDSPHPYVVLDARRSGELSYIFAVNDRRAAGPYLGQFGSVLERGVPITATLHLRKAPGVLYDALGKQQLPVSQSEGMGTTQVSIEPGWGKLLVACPEALGPPEVVVGDGAQTGGHMKARVQARHVSGRAVGGVVPLRVDIVSPDGETNDYSRFAATGEDGSWVAGIPIAENEPSGTWTLRVIELIGGRATTAYFPVADSGATTAVGRVVSGSTTIAAWRFDAGGELEEALGRDYPLTPRGRSRAADEGKSGGCLECFASVGDSREGVEAPRRPELAPPGAFAVELWLKPKPEMVAADLTFLLDCNYYLNTRDDPQANAGHAFFLKRGPDGLRPTVVLGFGDRTVTHKGEPVELAVGDWHRLGFEYDGAGKVSILLNGRPVGGGTSPNAGSITPARHPLVIGGRVGSTHYGCAGYVDEVRITAPSIR